MGQKNASEIGALFIGQRNLTRNITMSKTELTLYGYLFIALLMFGYSANAEFAEGETINSLGLIHPVNLSDRMFTGFFLGAVWPAYVTFKAFKFARPNSTGNNSKENSK